MRRNRATVYLAGVAVASLLLAGCRPPGPRELLDGERLIREGKYAEASAKLQIAVANLPQNAQAWNHLGLAYQYEGKPAEALKAYQTAVSLDRNLPAIRFNLGNLHLEQGRLGEAISELRTTTVLDPNSTAAWGLLGKAQLRARMVDDAERSFGAALRLNPNDVEALNYAGVAQLHRRKAREAYGYFTAALKQQPDYAPAVLNQAIVFHHYIVNKTNALAKYREYLAMKPDAAGAATAGEAARAIEAELYPRPLTMAVTNAPVVPAAVTNRTMAAQAHSPTVAPTNRVVAAATATNFQAAVPATNVARATQAPAPIATPVAGPAPVSVTPAVPAPTPVAAAARTNVPVSLPTRATNAAVAVKPQPAAQTNAPGQAAAPAPASALTTVVKATPTNLPPVAVAAPPAKTNSGLTSAIISKPMAAVNAPKTNETRVASVPREPLGEAPKGAGGAPALPGKKIVELAPAAVVEKSVAQAPRGGLLTSSTTGDGGAAVEAKVVEKPASVAPLEVVTLDDDSTIQAAPVKDLDAPKKDIRTTPLTLPPASKPVEAAAAAATETAATVENPPLIRPVQREEKASLLKKANPLNWFKRDKEEEAAKDSKGAKETKMAARPVEAPSSQPKADLQALPEPPPTQPVPAAKPLPKPEPVIARYPYQKAPLPSAGNRAAAEPRFAEGVAAHQDGKLGTAMDGYRAALRIDPRFFEAHLNLGLAALQSNDLPLALASLEDAVRLDGKSAEARYQFAMALRKANYPRDAANELKTLIETTPGEARAHLALANLNAQILNQPDEAAASYATFLKLAPQHPQADQVRAWLSAH